MRWVGLAGIAHLLLHGGVFAWGLALYGQALLAELHRLQGWFTGAIGSATNVSFLLGAGLLAWVGPAIARLGARTVLSGGAILRPLAAPLRT